MPDNLWQDFVWMLNFDGKTIKQPIYIQMKASLDINAFVQKYRQIQDKIKI